MARENEKKGESKKASDVPTESRSIGYLRVDVGLIQYIRNREAGGLGPTRMKQILSQSQFSVLSETTIRRHLRILVDKGILKEDEFRGQYCMDEGAYHNFCKDLEEYLKKIIGENFFNTIADDLRKQY